MYTKAVQLLTLVVLLFKNIERRTAEFVQLWEKLYILVQTPLPIKLRAKGNVYQRCTAFFLGCTAFFLGCTVFNCCTAFKNINMWTTEFVQLCEKFSDTIVNEIKSQGQYTKNV